MSLNQLAIGAEKENGITITKQALDQRMNSNAVSFLEAMLQQQLKEQTSRAIDMDLFKDFNRVRIKDSTKFDIHEKLAEHLPGFGGSASKASASIQYEFDIKHGKVIDLDIKPGKHSDAKDAIEKLSDVEPCDLILRDLGYFSLKALGDFNRCGAFFISKLNAKTLVYEQSITGELRELDFGKLYTTMKKNGIVRIEKQVFIGADHKMPVSMVIDLMCEEVIEQRVRKLTKHNKKKGHKTTSAYLDRLYFNLFITNIPKDKLDTNALPIIYKLRWQIELIFKIWKSTFGIHTTRRMKMERFLCLLYSKLLTIMINWEIVIHFRNYFYLNDGKWLSIDKCFKTIKLSIDDFRKALSKSANSVRQYLDLLKRLFMKKHWLEKRKNKIHYEEILLLLSDY